MHIQKTLDYSIFKKEKRNRPISQANVEKLMYSLLENNLMESKPVLVSKEMIVIDGQHRLAAAKALNMPIYYCVIEHDHMEAIQLLNSAQKQWTAEDFFHFHNELPNAIFLKRMEKEHGCIATAFMNIFKEKKDYKGLPSHFKDGIPLTQSHKTIEEFCIFISKLLDRFQSCTKAKIRNLKNGNFSKSLFVFFIYTGVDNKLLSDNIFLNYDLFTSTGPLRKIKERMEDTYNNNLRKGRRVTLIRGQFDAYISEHKPTSDSIAKDATKQFDQVVNA
jgi:hypothetical protein